VVFVSLRSSSSGYDRRLIRVDPSHIGKRGGATSGLLI
jgi:hypothetical protein